MSITKIIGALRKIWEGIFGRESKYKLDIELVPHTMHGCNVRSRIEPEQWKKVCSVVHKAARRDYRCQICRQSGKDQGFKHPVECHEIWAFNVPTRTQKLIGMLSLCPMCHKAKHIGLAERQGYGEATRAHLAKVNHITAAHADKLIARAVATVKERSNHQWTLDLTYLNKNEFAFLNIDFSEDEAHKCERIEY